MRELTPGELRYIDESVNEWKMYIRIIAKQELTMEDERHIESLEKAYKEAFLAFYKEAVQREEDADSIEIHRAFNAVYEKEHPEFYDVETLSRGVSS